MIVEIYTVLQRLQIFPKIPVPFESLECKISQTVFVHVQKPWNLLDFGGRLKKNVFFAVSTLIVGASKRGKKNAFTSSFKKLFPAF